MIIDTDIIQGTDEWKTAKAGKPSTSGFKKLLTPVKWEPSKSRFPYMRHLAAEVEAGRMLGWGGNAATRRGHEFEPEARKLYAWLNHVEVQEVGLCYLNESRRVVASPDGLKVGQRGGLEIKCRDAEKHINYRLTQKLTDDDWVQCQGCLYVTGYDYWDFFAYHPDLKPFQTRVLPDEKFLVKLHFELQKFCEDLQKLIERLKG